MKRINQLTDPQIAALYGDVPAPELERYKDFLREHPYRHLEFEGVDWAYMATAQSGAAAMLLSGALCAPEVSWKSIAGLAEQYHIIAPEYPAVKGMDALVDGIAAILRAEGLTQVHVLGGSYGGFVAQVFVRRHPELTRSLVLSHTLPPFPASGQRIENMLRWLDWIPQGVLRWLMDKRLAGLLPARTPETAGLHATYREMLRYRLGKPDLIALLARTADFSRRPFVPADLDGWAGNILLILSEDDPSTPEEVRAALQALYPRAETRLFRGGGHATAVSQQAEYLGAMRDFLERQA